MRRLILLFLGIGFTLLFSISTTQAAISRCNVNITQFCREVGNDHVLWFTLQETNSTRYYVREATWGVTKFDQFFSMLLTAHANNMPICFKDTETGDRFGGDNGWLIIQ